MEKNKLEVNAKMLLGFFSMGIILVLPLRAYQYLTIIEPGTGFYKGSNISIVLMYLFLAFFGGLIFAFALTRKKSISFDTAKTKSPVLGIIALSVAATLIIDSVIQSRNFSELYYGTNQNFGIEAVMEGTSSGLMRSGAIPMLLEAVFAALAALFFAVFGLGKLTGKSDSSEYKLLAVTPLAWSICRILHRFMRTISFINVSDLFFELIMLVLLMIFFMAFAQLIAKVNHKGVSWKLAGLGLPAAMFCLLCFVPRVAMIIMGRSDALADLSPPEYCDFTIALFILAFFISKVRFTKSERMTD